MANTAINKLVPPTPETVRRLLEQGVNTLTTFHDAYKKDKNSLHTEFWRGNLTGWRHTLVSAYGGAEAENMILEVAKRANLPIPHGGIRDRNGEFIGWDSLAGFP